MDKEGATKILNPSKGMHRLYYISFYGASKAYSVVKDIYDSTKPIKKFECIG